MGKLTVPIGHLLFGVPLHGFYLIFAMLTKKIRLRIYEQTGMARFPWFNNFIQILTTFFLVTFAWIFFRAKTVYDAFYIIKKLTLSIEDIWRYIFTGKLLLGKIPVSIRELT